jgi:hypothetical protein
MDMEHILDFPGMATDGGTLRIVVRHADGAAFSGSADPVPYAGPDDRSAGWWGRAMENLYGSDDTRWPEFEMQANHPGRDTAPADAVFRMPDC